MAPDRDYFITVSRLRLHVVEWGNPTAPPLMLVHGGKDHARNWDFVAEGLAGAYRIIAPDLRGHGDSDWASDGDYGFSDHVVDLTQLVETLDLGVFRLVGHSMGGNVVTRYAGLFPDRVHKLVNIEGLGMSGDLAMAELRAWVSGRAEAVDRTPRAYPSLEVAEQRLLAFNPRLAPGIARHLAQTGTRVHADGTVSFKYDPAIAGLSPVDLAPALKHQLWSAITCPVLLVYGADSWAKSPAADGRLARFQNARLEVFDAAAHWVQHDRLDAFVATLADFLAD